MQEVWPASKGCSPRLVAELLVLGEAAERVLIMRCAEQEREGEVLQSEEDSGGR